MDGFVPEIGRPVTVRDGTATRLNLQLDIGLLQDVASIFVSPAAVYRDADAAAHLRVGEAAGTQIVHGRPNVVSDVTILTTFKRPATGAPQPSWRRLTAPPNDQIADGHTLRVLQYAGAMALSPQPPAEVGDELLALLRWSCRETWEIGARFHVRGGLVIVPSAQGFSAWTALDGLSPSAFTAALERLGP